MYYEIATEGLCRRRLIWARENALDTISDMTKLFYYRIIRLHMFSQNHLGNAQLDILHYPLFHQMLFFPVVNFQSGIGMLRERWEEVVASEKIILLLIIFQFSKLQINYKNLTRFLFFQVSKVTRFNELVSLMG